MRRLGESTHRWRAIIAVLGLFAALGLMAGKSGAQDPEVVGRGGVTYRVYCQNCHGPHAKGDGRLAALMKVKVADLTQISKKNGGTFPTERVRGIIDGREDVLAHGDREMPIWGQVFTDRNNNEAESKEKVEQLIAFLESIQEKGMAPKK